MSAASRLSAEVDDGPTAVSVALDGELDVATVGIAEDALRGASQDSKALVLDLRKLRFLDSSGLRLILMTGEAATERNSRMFVVRGPAQVDRVFELTGARDRLEIVDDPALIEQG